MAVSRRLRTLLPLVAALVLTAAVVLWIRMAGGPEVIHARFGARAMLVTVPAHIATTLTPIGEVIPFGVANGAVYGWVLGAVLNWIAWMVAAVVQFGYGRLAVGGAQAEAPRWLRRWSLTHPVVLACGRWLPGGGPLVDAAAGAGGVPFVRAMALAALGHAPQALVIASVGAGLV